MKLTFLEKDKHYMILKQVFLRGESEL